MCRYLLVVSLFVVAYHTDQATSQSSPPPSYHLTYFDIRGRGEVIRLLFAAANQTYTERRVQFAEWAQVKPTMPFGQLPLLNISGSYYTQSLAIQNYLAREFGFYPTNAIDGLMTDQIANAREDLLKIESRVFTFRDSSYNQTLMDAYPRYLGQFNSYIKANPSMSGYVIGDKMSLADIIISEGTQTISQANPSVLTPYPEILALRQKVMAQDGIRQYLATRPVSRI